MVYVLPFTNLCMKLFAAPKSLTGVILANRVTGGIGSPYLSWTACNNILWPRRAIYIKVKETMLGYKRESELNYNNKNMKYIVIGYLNYMDPSLILFVGFGGALLRCT